MKKSNVIISSCKYCRYYESEGRRGGNCTQLGVSVNSSWKSCRLAIPSFISDWDNVKEIVDLTPNPPIYVNSSRDLDDLKKVQKPVLLSNK